MPQAGAKDARSVAAQSPGSDAPCPDRQYDREAAAPFVEAMLQPGNRQSVADVYKAMAPDGLARLAALVRLAEEQRKLDWANLCRYRSENARDLARGSRPEVVFVGDSITENWKHAEPSLFGANVLNRGISGQTTPQILLRFYQDVVKLRPRAVHIMVGTNDIGGNTGPVSDEAILDNIRAMIDLAKVNRIAVVLAAIPPAKAFGWRPDLTPADRIARLNRELEQIAKARRVVFVNYGTALADSDGGMAAEMGNDGVHPNRDGYGAMRPLAETAMARAKAASIGRR
jgi:lysophospholipase L1-like esterase